MLFRKFVSYLTDLANAFLPEGRVGGGREKLKEEGPFFCFITFLTILKVILFNISHT